MTDKKTLIYNAVLDLIKENGLSSGLKVSDIANKAGIGKGTVYEYFSNKEEIIIDSIIYLIKNTANEIFSLDIDKDLNFEEILISYINRLKKAVAEHISIHSLCMSRNIGSMISFEMKIRIKETIEGIKLMYDKLFSGIVKKGMDEGKLSQEIDPFNITIAKITLMTNTLEYIRSNKSEIYGNEEDFAPKLSKIIIKILS